MARTQKTKQNIYLDKTFGHEDDLLKSLAELTKKEGVERMQISPHEGKILQTLARTIGANKIVEIGSLYSYSTIYLARGLPKGKGKVFTCDISKKRHELSKSLIKNQPEYQQIEWITGKALETLKQLSQQAPFDMVFIDADKGNYGLYLDWAEQNLRPGGLLLADNTFLFGAVYEEPERESIPPKDIKVMQDFNNRLSQSHLWLASLLPTKEGLSLAIKQG